MSEFVDEIIKKLSDAEYFANEEIGYALLGAMQTNLPLLVEGEPGVGKSSLATATAKALNIPLIRIQCYEGITPESILYDYDYQRQLLVVSAIRDKINSELEGKSVSESVDYIAGNVEFFSRDFLLERPLLRALTQPGKKVLLIDEIDKTSEEIEHTLLEALSDFAITIPEIGTIRCKEEDKPIIILTSNRYRELSAPLKRRCLYLFIKQKTKEEISDILYLKVSQDEEFCNRIAEYLYQVSQLDLQHPTSISEGITWAKFLLSSIGTDDESIIQSANNTVGFLGKSERDRKVILSKVFEIR